jgi:hypothetical protein
MHRILAVTVGLCCCVLVAASPALAAEAEQTQTKPTAQQQEDAKKQMEAEMQKYAELAAPGEHHKHIAMFSGTWTSKNKMWPAPGAAPVESEGKAVNYMILGGRFLVQSYIGTMMDQPFEGMGIDGYDNVAGKHTSIWIDNFGTMILPFEGTCSKEDKSTTMQAEYKDPMTGKMTKMRTVSRFVSPTECVFEMYSTGPDGKEFKNMEITYTKQAEAKPAGS